MMLTGKGASLQWSLHSVAFPRPASFILVHAWCKVYTSAVPVTIKALLGPCARSGLVMSTTMCWQEVRF